MSQPFQVSPGDADRSVPTKVKLLIYSQILNNFAFGYFLIYLTAYLVESSVFDAYQVGVILGLETVIVIVAGIPVGILSDRTGRKKFLIFGNALIPVVLLIVSSTLDFDWFLLAAVLLGLAESSSLGSWNAIIADQTHLGNWDSAFSLSFVVSNLFLSGGFAIPLALPSLQGVFGLTSAQIHSGLFFWFGIFSIPVPLVIWLLLRGFHEVQRDRQEPERPGELKLLFKFSALNGIIGLGAGLIIPLLGSWFYYKFAVPDTFSGPFIALSIITIAFAAVASPRLSKKYGLFNSILLTAGSSTLFMFGMAFVPTVAIAGAVYLVRAALMNMASPLLDSYLMGIVHSGRRGLGSAISAIVWRLPNSVTTVVGGFLLYTGFVGGNHFLYDLPWILAAGLYVAGIGLLYFSFRNVRPRG